MARLGGVEAALGACEGAIEDALESSGRGEARDEALTAAIVSQLLPPLRSVSMQLLSVAAAAGGAAAGAAAASQPALPAPGPLRAELSGALKLPHSCHAFADFSRIHPAQSRKLNP